MVLQSMHDVYDRDALDQDELRLALQLVSLLNDCVTERRLAMADLVARHGAIYVPDSRGVLCSATELCYTEPDRQWVCNGGAAWSTIISELTQW